MNPMFSLPEIHNSLTDLGMAKRKKSVARLLLNSNLNSCLSEEDWFSIGHSLFDGMEAGQLETKIITEFEKSLTIKRGIISESKVKKQISMNLCAQNPMLKLVVEIAKDTDLVDENLLMEIATNGLSKDTDRSLEAFFNSLFTVNGSFAVINSISEEYVCLGIYPTAIELGKLMGRFTYQERQMLHRFLSVLEEVYGVFDLSFTYLWMYEQLVVDLESAEERFGCKGDKERLIKVLCEDPDSNEEESFMYDEERIRFNVELAMEIKSLTDSTEYQIPRNYLRNIKKNSSELLEVVSGMRYESEVSKKIFALVKEFLNENIDGFDETCRVVESLRTNKDGDSEHRFSNGLVINFGEMLANSIAEDVYDNCMQIGDECVEVLAFERSDDKLKSIAKRLCDIHKILRLLNKLSEIAKEV